MMYELKLGSLSPEIGSGFFRTVVMGDFPEDKAREFFDGWALPQKGSPAARNIHVIDDTSWGKIYEASKMSAVDLC